MIGRVCFSIGLCLAFASSKPAWAEDAGDIHREFVRALEIFDQAKSTDDYRASAAVLESILAKGMQSGAVYYNLGNAYYRAGELGRSILNYRKAKLYRPRDSYLEANLQQALAKAPGRLAEVEKPWWTHVLFWSEWISVPTKFNISTLGAILVGLLAFLSYYLQRAPFMWIALAVLTLSIVIGVDAALLSSKLMSKTHAVIVRECTARKGMADSYESAFDRPLNDGAEFTILSETDDWVFGHFNGVGDGWVRREFIAQ